MKREFNKRTGFTSKDDRIPAWMMREATPENGAAFDVPDEELDRIFNEID